MTTIYAWTTDTDDDAHDFVLVDIRGDAIGSRGGEIIYENVCAYVYWSEKVRSIRVMRTILEGPYSVLKALKRAETLRFVWQYDGVAISIPARSIWRSEWGLLQPHEGIKAGFQ